MTPEEIGWAVADLWVPTDGVGSGKRMGEPAAEVAVAALVPLVEARIRAAIAAEIREYAAAHGHRYEEWLFTYGSAVEPWSCDPYTAGVLDALETAARIAEKGTTT